MNAHIRDVTARFAREGYLAIAPELFHRSGPGFESSYRTFNSVMPHMQALTDDGHERGHSRVVRLAAEERRARASVGAVGYCMGGRTACLAAITVPVKGAVSYYGGGIGPGGMFPSLVDRLKDLKAPMLFFWGGKDEHIPAEQAHAVIEGLKAAKKTYVNVEFSDADHGFFCDARPSYNPAAAAQAWPLTLAFFDVHLMGASKGCGLKLMHAAPGELDSERDQPERKHDAKGPLWSNGREVGSGESSQQTAHYQLAQDRAIEVSGGDLESAADQRQAEAEKQVGADHASGCQFGEPEQDERAERARAGRRKSDFGADRKSDEREPAQMFAGSFLKRPQPQPVEIHCGHDDDGKSEHRVKHALHPVSVQLRQDDGPGEHAWKSSGQQVAEHAKVHLFASDLHRHDQQFHCDTESQRGSDRPRRRNVQEQDQHRRGDDACADAGDANRNRNQEAENDFHGVTRFECGCRIPAFVRSSGPSADSRDRAGSEVQGAHPMLV